MLDIALLRRRIIHLERFNSGSIKILGLIEILLAIILTIALCYACVADEDPGLYATPAAVLWIMGTLQYLLFYGKERLSSSLGILLIAETWLLSFLVSAIPFLLYGFSPEDALFEAVSGYTTTGASILTDFNTIPRSLLLWRGLIQWAGGLTVVVTFSLLMPMIGMGGAGLMSNEFTGSDSGSFNLKVTTAAKYFIIIYLSLTVLEVLILLFLNVTPFDSLCISLSNVPTGGLLPRSDSMASYDTAVQAVTLVFMILGALNFYLLFRLFHDKNGRTRKFGRHFHRKQPLSEKDRKTRVFEWLTNRDYVLFKSKEARYMLTWFLICTVIISLDLTFYSDYGRALWESLYVVISAGTGTGFSIMEYSFWPHADLFLILIIEFIGGCSGSTTGGAKIYRLIAVFDFLKRSMSKTMHPTEITTTSLEGRKISSFELTSIVTTLLLFILSLIIGSFLFMEWEGVNLGESFSVVMAALANAGIVTGGGPLDTFADYSILSKFLLCVLMWLGRMELILVLILFTRGFWSDLRISIRSDRFDLMKSRKRKYP
ncbi:MAG: TrkH family potassium uptake protein [archaeon]|nr:TrkH family potassium uptake protein [archaeon]